ncbi:MAG TPA: histidinol dehydrogenase [bacterium]|nr:histidinol dehydrogenase [bacterium]
MIPVLYGDGAWKAIDAVTGSRRAADPTVAAKVSGIIEMVRREGDSALRALAVKFNEPEPERILLSQEEVAAACNRVPDEAKRVIGRAEKNIRAFADAAMESVKPFELEREGFSVGMDFRPVASAGCYVPGGRYPLPSSALMTAVTASAAGVAEIAIASPRIRDEVVFAGTLAGVTRFYPVGGAQAIAALAFGTDSVWPVDMVVGPGNAFVTEAKRQLLGVVGIDMLAGPSEVVIIADGGADPRLMALEILAQAEHDPDSRAWFLTSSSKLAGEANEEVSLIAKGEGVPSFVGEHLKDHRILVFDGVEECVDAANDLSPEHLVLAVENPEALKGDLKNYGALFMSYRSTVAFGDYLSGPNHTLPTGTTARFSEGLNPRTFMRAQSWFVPRGDISALSGDTALFASMEGLSFHRMAAEARGARPKS